MLYYIYDENNFYKTYSFEQPETNNYTTIKPPQFDASVAIPRWNGNEWVLDEELL